MLSIVYSSAATRPFSNEDLQALLEHSRASNARLGLTGVLVYRSGKFLQLLEGEEAVVHERMTAIAGDDRHEAVRVLLEDEVERRSFPDWTMGFPQPDLSEQEVPGLRRAFDDIDADRSSAGTLPAFRALVGWFREEHDR
jgi:hypothetical protein